MRASSVPMSPTYVESICLCTTQPMELVRTTTTLSRTTTLFRRSWPSVRV